jgi:hypothetical protein
LVLLRLGCQSERVGLCGRKTSFAKCWRLTKTWLLVEHWSLTLETRCWLKSSLLLGGTKIRDLRLLVPLRLLLSYELRLWLEAGLLGCKRSSIIKHRLRLLLLKCGHIPLALLLNRLLESLGSESRVCIVESKVLVTDRSRLLELTE